MTIHVFIDTNFLWRKSLYEIEEMDTILGFAELLGGTVGIPQAVIDEWSSTLKSRVYDERKQLCTLSSNLSKLGVTITPKDFSLEEAFKRIEGLNSKFIRDKGIIVLGFPKNVPTLEELFAIAVEKNPPFDRHGNSFKDAMIVMSIDEFADGKPSDQIYLLTGDGGIKRDIRSRSKNVHVMKYDGLIEILKNHVGALVAARLSKVNSTTLEFVNTSRLRDLKGIIDQAAFNARDNLTRTVVKIVGFEFDCAESLNFTKIPEASGMDTVPFIALVRGRLKLLAKPTWLAERKSLQISPVRKIGEVRTEEQIDTFTNWAIQSDPAETMNEETEDCRLYVYGIAEFTSGSLSNIVFTSAKEPMPNSLADILSAKVDSKSSILK